MITEKVYLGRDDENLVTFKRNGVEIDFGVTTRMVATFIGGGVVVDTDVSPTMIDYSLGSGQVQFVLGQVDIPPGTYAIRLVAFDGTHPNGQVLVHESNPILKFEFVDG